MKRFQTEWAMTKFRFGKLAYLFVGLAIGLCLISGVALANSIMDQGAPGKYGAWPVTIIGAGGAGGGLKVNQRGQTGFPGVPQVVNLSANVSGAITGLTTGTCYWVTCNADSNFRVGTATPTAVATDNDLPARAIVTRCLDDGTATAFAFVSGSAAVCKVGVVQ